MAKNRMIATRFWTDSFVGSLKVTDRYLFLYLITNDHTNISGIYELTPKLISAETGMNARQIKDSFDRLSSRVLYIDGWVCIKNFQKYQASSSAQVQKALEVELSKVPESILRASKNIGSSEGIEKVSRPSNPSPIPNPSPNTYGSQSFLEKIPAEDLKELSVKYAISEKGIKNKAYDLKLYCQQKGRTYKNYRAFLENALRKDQVKLRNEFPLLREAPKIRDDTPVMSPERFDELQRKSKLLAREKTI